MSETFGSYLYLWENSLLWATPQSVHEWHAHLSTALFLALDAPFELQVGDAPPRSCFAALVRGNVPRRMRAPHANLQLNLEPDAPEHAPLSAALGEQALRIFPADSYAALKPRLRRGLEAPLDCSEASELFSAAITAVAGPAQDDAPSIDPRVAEAARRLRATLPAHADISQLAEQVGLSQSWLMHLFKRELGLSIRQYLRYLKIRKAACLLAAGWPLADMSVAAGFSDQAHATRTVQRTYGLNPSYFTASVRTHIRICDPSLQERWGIATFGERKG